MAEPQTRYSATGYGNGTGCHQWRPHWSVKLYETEIGESCRMRPLWKQNDEPAISERVSELE